jgi:twitching motility two-component system response regulator PilH
MSFEVVPQPERPPMSSVTIIDDDLNLLALFRALIDPFHAVSTYADAASALAGVRRDKPDVVLLDISLGDANGVDVLHALRAEAGLESVPVIAVTAHSQRIERAQFLAEGFTDFIAKPLTDHSMLLAVIETALRGESAPELDDDLGEQVPGSTPAG